MGESRTIARNTVLLTVGLVFGAVIRVLLTRMMSAGLIAEHLGVWFWATDVTVIVLTITRFGLDTLVTREVSRAPELTLRIVVSALGVRWIMAALCYGLLLGYLFLTGKTEFERAALLVTAVAIFIEATAMVCDAVLQAHQKVKYQSLGQIVSAAVYFALAWWALSAGHGVMGVIWANLASRLVRLLVMIPPMLRHAGPWKLQRTDAERALNLRWMLKLGFPLFLAYAMAVIYTKVDVVMLKEMKGSVDVAIYGLGHRGYDVLLMLPNLFATALFPTMARYGQQAGSDVVRLGNRSLRFMNAAILPVTALVVLMAPLIIAFFDRQHIYGDSVPVLRLIVLALPLQAVNTLFNRLLITADRERVFVFIAATTMTMNVVLNLLLIPRYSYDGAALATVITYVTSSAMHLYFLRRTEYRVTLWRPLPPILLALATAWFGTAALARLLVPSWGTGWLSLPTEAGWVPSLVVAALCGLLYLAAAFGLRVLRREDLELLRRR